MYEIILDKNAGHERLGIKHKGVQVLAENHDDLIREACKRNDPMALDLIWEAYASRLLAFAIAILCSHHDAEEIIQNVFVKIAVNRSRIAAAGSIRAYLFTMTRNESLSYIRKRGNRRETIAAPRDLWLVPAHEAEPTGRDEADAAIRHLEELPENQREVIVLKFFEGMTFDEIASSLCISLNTAASRYRYGMEKLRRRMNGGK